MSDRAVKGGETLRLITKPGNGAGRPLPIICNDDGPFLIVCKIDGPFLIICMNYH